MCVHSVRGLYVHVCMYICVLYVFGCAVWAYVYAACMFVCVLCMHMCVLYTCICVYVVCGHECMYVKFECMNAMCVGMCVCVYTLCVCIYTVGVCAHALPSVQCTRHTVLHRATHTSQGAQVCGLSASRPPDTSQAELASLPTCWGHQGLCQIATHCLSPQPEP